MLRERRPLAATREIKKQVSLFLPVSQWRKLRNEAARRRIPITELVRQWMNPHLNNLPTDSNN